jgi:hypothetical protein
MLALLVPVKVYVQRLLTDLLSKIKYHVDGKCLLW